MQIFLRYFVPLVKTPPLFELALDQINAVAADVAAGSGFAAEAIVVGEAPAVEAAKGLDRRQVFHARDNALALSVMSNGAAGLDTGGAKEQSRNPALISQMRTLCSILPNPPSPLTL